MALVQPVRLNSGELNTHTQLGPCTQCCLKGKENIREGKKGYTEWPGIWGMPLSTLCREFWKGGFLHLSEAARAC